MVACKVQDLQSPHPVNLPGTPQAEPRPFGTSFCSPGADGASAFAFSGSGINDRLPDVSRTAFPPDALMAAYREHFRHQIAVARRIPLGGKLWVARCQVIKTGQNAPARAIGTASVFYGSGCNDRLPRMSAGTPPTRPFYFCRASHDPGSNCRCVLYPILRQCPGRASAGRYCREQQFCRRKPGSRCPATDAGRSPAMNGRSCNATRHTGGCPPKHPPASY